MSKSTRNATNATNVKGKASIVDTMTKTQLKASIDELIAKLRKTTDQGEKKKIRRMLRTRGHRGGLQSIAVAKAGKKRVVRNTNDDATPVNA